MHFECPTTVLLTWHVVGMLSTGDNNLCQSRNQDDDMFRIPPLLAASSLLGMASLDAYSLIHPISRRSEDKKKGAVKSKFLLLRKHFQLKLRECWKDRN